MTKRFTYKVADDLLELARIQAKIKAHHKQLRVLEQAERNLKARLPDYFDQGDTEVDYVDGTVARVHYNVNERRIIDGDKVALHYAKIRKPVPMKKVDIVTFAARVIQ